MSTEVVKCSQCNIVINELLCFTQNKICVMDEVSLIRLIKSDFSALEISDEKELLFTSFPSTVRKVARRKNKEQKDVEDIISAFKTVDPDKIPIFVAKELHKLPPVTFDHIDATRLLKDIVLLQSELKLIKETYVTSEYLKTELNNMKYASLVNEEFNVNNRRGAYLLDSRPTGFLNIDDASASIKNAPDVEARSAKQQVHILPCSTLTQSPCLVHECSPTALALKADEDARTRATEQLTRSAANHTVMNTASGANVTNNDKSMAEIVMSKGEWKPKASTLSNEWSLVQKRRYRNRTEGIRGKASIKPEDRFRPADLKIQLFVSNVHKHTSEKNIIE